MLSRYSRAEMEKVWSEEQKYEIWLEIELAILKARAELGEIPIEAAEKIEQEAEVDLKRIKEIEAKTRHDMIAFIEGISENLGEESRFIHEGVTSSDIKDTARSMQMKQACKIILEDLEDLHQILAEKALADKDTIMVGRTHGVHAEPITWGLKLLNWYQEIGRQITRFKQLQEVVAVGQISGAVGTFATINPEVEKRVCEILGLKNALVSSQILQRDRHADFIERIALAAASIEKFATEIRNLQRTDILEVEEGFRKGQKGSSAMPHKKNPIVCERLSGLARVVRGNVVPALENISLWHERDLTHSSVERVILPDSAILLDYMLVKFQGVIEELVVNEDNMKLNLEKTLGLTFSQRLMLALVEKGLRREEAYELAQRNAMTAWEKKTDYRKLVTADQEISKYLSEEEMERIFDWQAYLKNIDQIFKRNGLSE
ncbi:MAG: adenylosuccinate lyase [Halanaerobium sp. 4-GBenrich]|jgi:adenylosuccinate lyase|uniref:Adenylosuccinate lyase n=1 Tax=Halanaerobium congolense TaxID=54121 RepID=A0A1G6IPN6_9FIRM|nr:adenylosuccinate lyase [Halanaerobium congolense]ODS50675.1 MAG: adenylosuccinate lyase [Halanaerobium sp. 4-GBenrich]OEG62447.1 MAG: adenylosuccinate lyase [Halanaerobium sp. MDAL1]PUU89633.1 MAG: adenylosuccinate lyase [Halanaerobium sp.]PTX15909.1 adenylosuccinate lyase [Halanaerobium congolense]PXV64502.1 adenylosuccinate lyase [Halanaerobium congolense]